MKINFLNLIFLCGCVLHLHAQQNVPLNNSKEFLDKLKAKSQKTNSIQAAFTEEKLSSYLKQPHISSGVFYYKKPNRMRWEKLAPTPYVFIVNQDKIRISEAGKEKDVSSFNEGVAKIKELMLVLVNGDFANYKAFEQVYLQNDKQYVVKLIPKNKRMANVFKYIQLTFSKQTMALQEMSFYEKSGDRNIMRFQTEKLNTEVSDALFTKF